jgi:hypothetical protein
LDLGIRDEFGFYGCKEQDVRDAAVGLGPFYSSTLLDATAGTGIIRKELQSIAKELEDDFFNVD